MNNNLLKELKEIKLKVFQEALTEAQLRETDNSTVETDSERIRREKAEYFRNYDRQHRKEQQRFFDSIPKAEKPKGGRERYN